MKTDKILKAILNKKLDQQKFLTGTVTTLSPLKVKLYAADDEINVVATTNLTGLKIGSRLLLVKFQNQFIALCIVSTNNYNYPKLILKTADKSITSSTTLANDNHLTATLEAGFIYEIDFNIYILASTTGDFKSLIVLGGSASFDLGSVYTNRYTRGGGINTTSVTNATAMSTTVLSMEIYPTTPFAYGGTGGSSYGNNIKEKVLISTLSGEGTITLQWSQYISDTTATIVKKGSYMKITPVFL